MNITIEDILNETEFTLGVWAVKLKCCRGIRNNFEDKAIQDVIDFKGERETEYYDEAGYCEMISTIWDNYTGGFDTGSSHWHHANMKYISDFIMALAKRIKAERIQLKKQKVKDLKADIVTLENEIKVDIIKEKEAKNANK